MNKLYINTNFILRKYGNLFLGYFQTDKKTRYITIEGMSARIIDVLLSKKGCSFTELTLGCSIDSKALRQELDKLVSMNIVEEKYDTN